MTLTALVLMMTTLVEPASSRQSLDGQWQFMKDTSKLGITNGWFQDSVNRSAWVKRPVPALWESYSGMKGYDGWGWFSRSFSIDSLADPMTLFFEGVDDDAIIWLNGKEVGRHEGYADSFAVDLTGALRKGDNNLVVLVKDYGGGGGIYRSVTLIKTKHVDQVLPSTYAGIAARPSAPWVKSAVIYSVYLRSFSPEGTFAGLEKRIPELKQMGVTVLWLLPIHPIGVKNRKGHLGSPYSIVDYYRVNPEFGTLGDFKHLLSTAHKNGLKLIIDMVANHTSWDSWLMAGHPDWFTHDSSGAIVSPNKDWTDVADLDYSKPGLRSYMEDMMAWWIEEVGIDGFRCDVAEMVPLDFWEHVRARLDTIKPVMMLAEGSKPELHAKAFDLTYSWNLYDQLDSLLSGNRPATVIDSLLLYESLQYPTGALRMRFTTNHDKNAWDAPAVEKFGISGLRAATVLTNTIPGVPMLYTGEEAMNNVKLSLFEKVPVDWSRPRELGTLNTALFMLRSMHPAMQQGEMVRIPTDHDRDVYAFVRVLGSDRVLVVINLHPEPVSATLTVPAELRESMRGMRGLFGKVNITSNADGRATVSLGGHEFDIAPR